MTTEAQNKLMLRQVQFSLEDLGFRLDEALDKALLVDQNLKNNLSEWFASFHQQIFGARSGYANAPVYLEPVLEDRLVTIGEKWFPGSRSQVRKKAALLPSHDLDYLVPTPQLWIKNTISRKSLRALPDRLSFVESLEALMQIDSRYATGKTTATVFIACPRYAGPVWKKLAQLLLDPSYDATDPLLGRVVASGRAERIEFGLHTSYFSHAHPSVENERAALLSLATSTPIGNRQHWLNLRSLEDLERLQRAGFLYDSSLGWNGAIGFRGGFARPFRIALPSNGFIWEIPLVAMDGVLFQDMSLDEEKAVERVRDILCQVLDRKGAASIDWHERAAASHYGWHGAYERILGWAKDQGFDIHGLGEAIEQPDENRATKDANSNFSD